jgi:hypothetical protein
VTKAVRPGGGFSVLIDTTLNTHGDPAASAATLESGARSSGAYRRLVYRRTTLGSDPSFVWAYRQGGSTKVDVLFYRGDDGFGVLAEGPTSELATLRALASRVAQSVTPRQKPTPEPEPQPANCDPSYEGECLNPDSPDYDCAGGSGDGPDYVQGSVEVIGDDHFDLDRDGDGTACE